MNSSSFFNKHIPNEAAFIQAFDQSQQFCQRLEILADAKRFKYLCVAEDGKLTEVGVLTKLFEELKGLFGFVNNCGAARLRTGLKWLVKCALKRNWVEPTQVEVINKIAVRANLLTPAAPSQSDGKFLKFMDKVDAFFKRQTLPVASIAPAMGPHTAAVIDMDDNAIGAHRDGAAECLELVSSSPALANGQSYQPGDAAATLSVPSSSLPEVAEQSEKFATSSRANWLSSAAKGALFVSSIMAIGVALRHFWPHETAVVHEFDQREVAADAWKRSGKGEFTPIDLRLWRSDTSPTSAAAEMIVMPQSELYRLSHSVLPDLSVMPASLAKSTDNTKQLQFDEKEFDGFLKFGNSTETVKRWLKDSRYGPHIQARLAELSDKGRESYNSYSVERALTGLFKRCEGKEIVETALESITQMRPDVEWTTTVLIQAIESDLCLDEIEAALAQVFDPARERSFAQLEMADRFKLRAALNSLFNKKCGQVILARAIEENQVAVLKEASAPWCVGVLIESLSNGKWRPERLDYFDVVGAITGMSDNGLPFLEKAYRERDELALKFVCSTSYYQGKLVGMMLKEGPVPPELDRRGDVKKDFYRSAFSLILGRQQNWVGEGIEEGLQRMLERALADGTVSILEVAIEKDFGVDLIRQAVLDGTLGNNNSDKQSAILHDTCDALYKHGALLWHEHLRYC